VQSSTIHSYGSLPVPTVRGQTGSRPAHRQPGHRSNTSASHHRPAQSFGPNILLQRLETLEQIRMNQAASRRSVYRRAPYTLPGSLSTRPLYNGVQKTSSFLRGKKSDLCISSKCYQPHTIGSTSSFGRSARPVLNPPYSETLLQPKRPTTFSFAPTQRAQTSTFSTTSKGNKEDHTLQIGKNKNLEGKSKSECRMQNRMNKHRSKTSQMLP
jgi:hypothetical protein